MGIKTNEHVPSSLQHQMMMNAETKTSSQPIIEDRFAALFKRREFQVDEAADEYVLHHRVALTLKVY